MTLLLPDRPGVRVRIDGEASFSLVGEIDLATEPAVRRHVLPRALPGVEVRLDIGGVNYLDSTALNLFVQILRAVGDDGRLVVSGASPFVRKVLQVSGLERHPRLLVD